MAVTSSPRGTDYVQQMMHARAVQPDAAHFKFATIPDIIVICRWFDLVIVLQCENSFLYDRLAKRYTVQKLAGTGPTLQKASKPVLMLCAGTTLSAS